MGWSCFHLSCKADVARPFYESFKLAHLTILPSVGRKLPWIPRVMSQTEVMAKVRLSRQLKVYSKEPCWCLLGVIVSEGLCPSPVS
jgi:hypothetical protein